MTQPILQQINHFIILYFLLFRQASNGYLRARDLITMGLPGKPKAALILFSRYRSIEKCSLPARLVKAMKVGGEAPGCVR